MSAKYGLLKPDDIITPYEKTLNRMNKKERIIWAANVIEKLKQECDLEKDRFIVLAGRKYREFLLPRLQHYELPLNGLSLGNQIKYYKNVLRSETIRDFSSP